MQQQLVDTLTCDCRDSIFSPQTLVGIRCGFEAVSDLETARIRLEQLASVTPGEYFIFDLHAKQIVSSMVSTNEQVTST
jgi:hypothetical protein